MHSSGSGSLAARVRIVLSHTSHPGNIGAAARAMKTMGLARLVLVRPKFFPDPDATARASGASDLLEAARVCGTLDEALAGTTLALAVTARRRELSHVAADVRESAALAIAELARDTGEVAFVFGTELSGLANDEVIRCQRIVHIPTAPDYGSLNLAQAVQVIAYELRMAVPGGAALAQMAVNAPPLASYDEVEQFYAHLERALIGAGFLDPGSPRRLMERLRRLFGRTRIEREEINILRGMLSAFENPRPPGG